MIHFNDPNKVYNHNSKIKSFIKELLIVIQKKEKCSIVYIISFIWIKNLITYAIRHKITNLLS